jgi:hypothetical protein
MFKKLLTRERASRRVMGHFYKAIVQSILLYWAETWVVYIQRRRDTVFTFVKNREIYQECLELETYVENSEYIYWWKQPFNLAKVINT